MIVTNISDGRKAYALPHASYCLACGRCACLPSLPLGTPRRPATLVLAEGERRTVPRAVLSVPAVARAVRRGQLRIEEGA